MCQAAVKSDLAFYVEQRLKYLRKIVTLYC